MGCSGGKWWIITLICSTTQNIYTILTTKIQCVYISSFLIFLQLFTHTFQDWLSECVKLVTICYNLFEKRLDLYGFFFVNQYGCLKIFCYIQDWMTSLSRVVTYCYNFFKKRLDLYCNLCVRSSSKVRDSERMLMRTCRDD